MFLHRLDKGEEGGVSLGAVKASETSGDLLVDLRVPDGLFGGIVMERDIRVREEMEYLVLVFQEAFPEGLGFFRHHRFPNESSEGFPVGKDHLVPPLLAPSLLPDDLLRFLGSEEEPGYPVRPRAPPELYDVLQIPQVVRVAVLVAFRGGAVLRPVAVVDHGSAIFLSERLGHHFVASPLVEMEVAPEEVLPYPPPEVLPAHPVPGLVRSHPFPGFDEAEDFREEGAGFFVGTLQEVLDAPLAHGYPEDLREYLGKPIVWDIVRSMQIPHECREGSPELHPSFDTGRETPARLRPATAGNLHPLELRNYRDDGRDVCLLSAGEDGGMAPWIFLEIQSAGRAGLGSALHYGIRILALGSGGSGMPRLSSGFLPAPLPEALVLFGKIRFLVRGRGIGAVARILFDPVLKLFDTGHEDTELFFQIRYANPQKGIFLLQKGILLFKEPCSFSPDVGGSFSPWRFHGSRLDITGVIIPVKYQSKGYFKGKL